MVASFSRSLCLLLCTILFYFWSVVTATENNSVPATLNVGALVAYNTVIGRVAKQAIELAVADINRNGTLLNGSEIVLQMLDTNCGAFQGAATASELLKREVVAVAGPQSSAVSHFVAQMGGATQVPLVSFAATDPALSEFQYPYFFRIAHSDRIQMEAIAALIGYYGWMEVVALFTDDDFGTNGVAVLSDALELVGARILQKAALVPGINRTDIGNVLKALATIESRVFVVHMPQDVGLVLFSEAKYLGMMSAGYVWIVTDGTIATLDMSTLDADAVSSLQGIVGTRCLVPDSSVAQAFQSEWNNQQIKSGTSVQLNIYGRYAYDSMWMIAHALDSYLRNGSDFIFKKTALPQTGASAASELAQLRIFNGGPVLRHHILDTKFNGASGVIQVDSKGDLIRSAFEIVNIKGSQMRVVGYWTNETNISPSTGIIDESLVSLASTASPNAPLSIIWPGNINQTPRGWVLPRNGKPLRIAVPYKTGFKQFVSWSDSSNVSSFHGFCIDVFQNALNYIPYAVPYIFVPYGNGSATPNYDDMIDQLANKAYDGVVGDVTITTKRMQKADFTQPFVESGLVVVVPAKNVQSGNAWAFLLPFTPLMWFTTLAFFVFTGVVVWMLEHKRNRDFRGQPKKQVVTVLWFTFSTLFFSQRENTKSTLARFVIIIWLFVVLIITSSYTANLTSILTVQQLTPTIQGISSLQQSHVPIGYQTGSFAEDYLISLNIAKDRLKPLPSVDAYEKALLLGPDQGGVAAIVDELPYIQVFLSTYCGFTIAGQEFTKAGWGFAFPRDSELAIDMSTAILTLSESGELQRIHDVWLETDLCSSTSNEVQSGQLSLSSFWGLFLITGMASVISLLIYIARLVWQFRRRDALVNANSGSSRSRRFIKYVDESAAGKKTNANHKSKEIALQPDHSSSDSNSHEPDSIST